MNRPPTAGASRPDTPATRTAALLGSLLLVSLVLAPIRRLWQEKPRDDFPFSHYPMFSTDRKNRTWLYHLRGYDADGGWTPLSYRYLGHGGLNQVRRQTRLRARAGDGALLAARAARALARRDRPEDAGVVRVDMVKAKYLLDEYMAGDREPVRCTVLGSAPVPGRSVPAPAPAQAPAQAQSSEVLR